MEGSPDRNRINAKIIKLIQDMNLANSIWGVTGIHNEKMKFGIEISHNYAQIYGKIVS